VANPLNDEPVFASFGERFEKSQISTSFILEEEM